MSQLEKSLSHLHQLAVGGTAVGTGLNSVPEFGPTVCTYLESKTKIKFLKKRSGDNPKLVCNINKAIKKLNWKPINSSINKIITDEINWYKILDERKISRRFIY